MLASCLFVIVGGQQELAETENRRYQAYKLADELRQSSDDLTRMARTYVVTGDPMFEQYFRDILAIRDGENPRPLAYDRIYWDFVIASQQTPDKAGPAISLVDRMESLDLTEKEREQLKQAKANSDALVALENKAMNAVKGLFDDGSQNYVAGRPPDLDLARSIMFGEDYHAAKAAIMKPIDDFLMSLENRMNAAVAGQRETVRFLMTAAAFLVALTLVTFVTLAIVIRRRVIGPVDKLVQQSEAIREGAYGYQVAVKRDDEIGILAGALNRMSTAISDDVAKRQKVKEALQQQTEFLNTILESSPIAATIVNPDGTIEFANTRALEMADLSKEEFLATDAHDFYVDPNERDKIYQKLSKQNRLRDIEVQFKKKDGTPIWALVSYEPTGLAHKPQFFAWAYDITERKEAEEELRRSKEQTEQALANLKNTQERLVQTERIASLGQLTAGIAHEIKNPLNFVNNFAETSVELIEELEKEMKQFGDRIDGEARDNILDLFDTLKGDLGKINTHGRRADGIVKTMLLHAHGDGSNRVEVALNPLVSEALKLAYHGERAKDNSFQVKLDEQLEDSAGAAEVVPQAITRVLLNLIGNAFYAVKKRAQAAEDKDYQPTVSVATRGRGDRIEIRVRDNGLGIPKEVQEKLFEPFFTTKPPGEGTGLGLSICYDIVVQQHGGNISVDGAPGKGAEFIVELSRSKKGRSRPSIAEGTT
jgi:PAS domain S-box-containing protein